MRRATACLIALTLPAGLTTVATAPEPPLRVAQDATPIAVDAPALGPLLRHLLAILAPATTTTTSTSTTTTSTTLPPAPVPQDTGAPDLLDALADCESGGDPTTNTGNGYYGAYQFTLSTWRGLGGTGMPYEASYAEQKEMAAKIPLSAWPEQFPACSALLGVG